MDPGSLAGLVDRAPSTDHPSPFGKGKGKISEIRYLSGSEYFKAAVKYADVVGPSRVEPLYEKTFVTRYRPPLGVQVWCPDLLTFYIVQVPKMVCVEYIKGQHLYRILIPSALILCKNRCL